MTEHAPCLMALDVREKFWTIAFSDSSRHGSDGAAALAGVVEVRDGVAEAEGAVEDEDGVGDDGWLAELGQWHHRGSGNDEEGRGGRAALGGTALGDDKKARIELPNWAFSRRSCALLIPPVRPLLRLSIAVAVALAAAAGVGSARPPECDGRNCN